MIRITEARHLLVSAGKISNPKNAYTIIHGLLTDRLEDRFEWVAKGTFRLRQNGQHALLEDEGETHAERHP